MPREGKMEAIQNARNLTKEQKKVLKIKHTKAALRDLAPPEEGKDAIRNIFIYCIFMIFFTLQTSRGLTMEDIYYFGANIKSQLTEVEFKPQHAPQWAKTYNDITTAEEFYQWMLGPLIHTAFSDNTFDGTSSWDEPSAQPIKSSILGYGKLIGAVRISQLRSNRYDCNPSIYKTLKQNHTFECYGNAGNHGAWSLGTENKSAYGNLVKHDYTCNGYFCEKPVIAANNYISKQFLYDGVEAPNFGPLSTTVSEEREQFLSSYLAKSRRSYPAPAYSVLLPPMMTPDEASAVINDMIASKYIDLHTKAIFVEMSVYNPHLDRVCYVRLLGEISRAGGVRPQSEVWVTRLWEQVTSYDQIAIVYKVIVGLFYAWYIVEFARDYLKRGSGIFKEFLVWIQVLNFVFYFAGSASSAYAEVIFPATININANDFVPLLPTSQFKEMSVILIGCNVFLNWFKFIQVLSYSPTFNLVNLTLANSAKGVGSFLVVVFVVAIGFTQCHCMIFQGRLEEFRDFRQSVFALIRSLLGDFNFEQLNDADPTMGPMLFFAYVGLMLFVVLNMVIAIISEAYDTARKQVKQLPDNDLLADMKNFLILNSIGHPKIEACMNIAFRQTMARVYAIADEATEEIDEKVVEVLAPAGKLFLDFQEVYAPGLGGDGEQRSAGVMVSAVKTGPLFGKVVPGYYLMRLNATDTTHMSLRQVATLLQQTSEHAERVLMFRMELEDGLELNAFGGEKGEVAVEGAGQEGTSEAQIAVAGGGEGEFTDLTQTDSNSSSSSSSNSNSSSSTHKVKTAADTGTAEPWSPPSTRNISSSGDRSSGSGSSGGGGGGFSLTGGNKLAQVMDEIQGLRGEFNEVKQSVADIHATMNKMMKMMGTTPQLTV